MTATCAGSSGCLTAKGLDISLAALQRQDPYINNIVDVASQVALYTYNNRANEWEKTEVEGTLFIYTRQASPRHGFTIMNRLNMENLTEPITKDLDFQLQDPFLLYRNARLVIHGIWFYDKQDCQRVAQKMRTLTQQEQILAQSQGGWLSPGRGGVEAAGERGRLNSETKGVDILQMLTKARTVYDKEKSTSEPKEIGGSSVLSGNPNLIKPIPVKPNSQDGEGMKPKALSLASLFGPQHQHQHTSNPVPFVVSPTSMGKVARPPVARTLTYDDAVNSSRSAPPTGRSVPLAGGADGRVRAVAEGEGTDVVVVLQSSSPGGQGLPNQPQHCPAIAKLMQGQQGVGGTLQTLPESPENRLCDNGLPLEHHHHHHHLYHQQHQHHQLHQHQHHQHQQNHQHQPDPIKRLLQSHAPPQLATSFSAPPCSSNPHLSSKPVLVDPVPCSHLQAQQNQQLFFNLFKSQTEALHSQAASAALPTGLLPSQLAKDQGILPLQGLSAQMQGVVSPHELLQKLQLVQQEQCLTSHEPPRPHPGLAPRFLGPTQNQEESTSLGTVSNLNSSAAGQKAALQLQVISPQRIPATVAPTMLLSPSVFTQTKPSGGLPGAARDSCPAPSALSQPSLKNEVGVLSRSQLQATLLHLIQSDSSFLDSIYDAYVSRFAKDSSSKY
ncbi:mRNA-decapping enzyme 1B [Menidia menidia]